MKKVFIIALICCLPLLITACSSDNKTSNELSGTMTCTNESIPSAGVKLQSVYKIHYKDGYVTKLETDEKIEAEDNTSLEDYKETLESAYASYNELDYYSNVITIKDNTLYSTTEINYAKIDTDKLISIDESNSSLIKKGKIKIDDIKVLYQENGSTCK